MRGLVAAANQDPRLTRVFSTFTATNPSLFLDIDRDKAQALGLSISDVFTALQATLGGIYVNNFNLYGRTWQVNIEGEPADRADIPAIWQIFVRNKTRPDGAAAVDRVACAMVTGPQVITRYNNYRVDHHQRRAGAGRVVGHRAGRDGGGVGEDAAAGLRLRMDRHRLSGGAGGRADRVDPGAGGAVRLSVPGRAVRKLDHPDPGAAVGGGRRAGRVSSASGSPGCRSISMRRSAWWC